MKDQFTVLIKREKSYIKNESWEKDKDRENKDMLKTLQSQQFKYINEWVDNNPIIIKMKI